MVFKKIPFTGKFSPLPFCSNISTNYDSGKFLSYFSFCLLWLLKRPTCIRLWNMFRKIKPWRSSIQCLSEQCRMVKSLLPLWGLWIYEQEHNLLKTQRSQDPTESCHRLKGKKEIFLVFPRDLQNYLQFTQKAKRSPKFTKCLLYVLVKSHPK